MNRLLDTHVRTVACKLFAAINTPISLSCYILLMNEEWEQLCEKRVSPSQYLDCTAGAIRFDGDYQAVSYLRKYDGFPIRRNLKQEAVNTFYANERQCKLSNLRLSALEYPIGIHPRVLELLHNIRKVVAEVLGPVPLSLDGRFGPGTVYEFNSAHGDVYRNVCGKLTSAIHCTPAAASIVASTIYPTSWGRALCAGDPSNTGAQLTH